MLDELRQEGLSEEYMDYNRVVRDVSEAVKGGDTPAQAKRYAKQRAIGRSLDLREPKITKFVNPNELPDLPLGLNHVASQAIEDKSSFQGDMSMKRSQGQLSEHSFLPAVQTPEVIQLRKRLLDQIKNSDDYLMNLKSPSDWTKAELQEAMKAREKALPQDKAGMLQRERQWFDHYYGNEPVKYDETGKMVQPGPVRSIPQEPVPIKTKDGKDLGEALDRVIGNLPGLTGDTGSSLNPPVYNEEKGGWVQFDPTTGSYKKIEAPITPGYHLLDQKKATGPLGSVNGVPVAPGQTGQNRQAIQSDRHLAVMPSEEQVIKGLQAGLNMLSNKQNQSPLPNVSKTTALKEDGIVGPKTQDAFHQIAKKTDEDELTQRFADNLGFRF